MLSEYLEGAVENAIISLYGANTKIDFSIVSAGRNDSWDFSTNAAFKLAKPLGKSPKEIAAELANELSGDKYIASVEALNGHVNFVLASYAKYDSLVELHDCSNFVHHHDTLWGHNVVLEFVSANPTGPLSVVNGRAGVLGSALANLYYECGAHVTARYYVNDNPESGQIIALRNTFAHYDNLANGIESEFPEDGYKGDYVKKAWQHYDQFKKTVGADLAFTKYGISTVTHSQIQDLAKIRVTYNHVDSENKVISELSIQKAFEHFGKNLDDFTYVEDGAVMLKTSEYGDDKDRVIIRQDGRPTYYHNDIIYHVYKMMPFSRWGAKLVNIWGADHHGYIARVNAAMRMLGAPDIEVILTQMVNLEIEEDGVTQVFMGSKREGQYLLLIDDFVDKVGVDAARWYFLMDNPSNHTTINVQKAAEQNMSNPVFYVQYAHARLCSIVRKSKDLGVSTNGKFVNLTTLESEISNELILKLENYGQTIERAATQSSPQMLKTYLYDLAQIVHKFYEKERLINQPLPNWLAGLYLVETATKVLKHGLSVLDISAPETMFAESE